MIDILKQMKQRHNRSRWNSIKGDQPLVMDRIPPSRKPNRLWQAILLIIDRIT